MFSVLQPEPLRRGEVLRAGWSSLAPGEGVERGVGERLAVRRRLEVPAAEDRFGGLDLPAVLIGGRDHLPAAIIEQPEDVARLLGAEAALGAGGRAI